MDKKHIFGIIQVILLICIIFLQINHNSKEESSRKLNILSQCYTQLQPSVSFSSVEILGQNGNIALNKNEILDWHKVSNTGSMRPTIPDGGVIITIKPKREDLNVGDIISVKDEDGLILHRIIKINPDETYVTKGDNNAAEDWINWTFEQVEEKVVGVLY
jgi:signal peptidase I